MNLIEAAERSLIPDSLVRIGIRQLLSRRIREESAVDCEVSCRRKTELIEQLRQSPLALETDKANQQHYELPAEFFATVLGPQLKYSCCLFPDAATSLADAESRMLDLTCERADLADGMEILELGCGWGSLTTWMARRYPHSRIVAVSNSRGQRQFIEGRCRERGLDNVRVVTADMREFEIDQQFDRVVSVEMFEHMRNYRLLLDRIAGWLHPGGKLFTHVFCHRELAYLFETEGTDNWMGRHFFTGGIMPSEDLLLHFQDRLVIDRHWRVSGMHYFRTCEAWLERLDRQRDRLLPLMAATYGQSQARVALQRWRMFFMACAELFRYDHGNQWFVAHYLFEQRAAGTRSAAERSTAEAIRVT
ncbi:MAG: class I SAM-dependent methyltransferase [Pirellulaceae bacterium]|nr:class I SAM-dependent methyltransferase [Pirellulaceae bacterium]